MAKQKIDNTKRLWLVLALLGLGFGLGGGLSNLADHGLTFAVMLQMAGGIGMMIIGIYMGLKK